MGIIGFLAGKKEEAKGRARERLTPGFLRTVVVSAPQGRVRKAPPATGALSEAECHKTGVDPRTGRRKTTEFWNREGRTGARGN